ncbi:ead/Ea22-like family protein [Klebsiella pneumoniae]|uniref:hypothetical protein n=1 Tax=Klebsiella pneumoniae TaxID=573 RepID=UPI00333998BE
MTDITELAQREKFEAWVMTQICISKSTLEGLRTADGYRNSTLSGTNYNRMWDCWKEAGAELVEALEKSEKTSEARREAIDRTHNMFVRERDRANAAEEALEKAQQHIARQEQILLNQDESLSIRRGELEAAQQERESWRTSFDNERFRADKLKAHIDDIEPVRAAAEKLVRCKGRYHSELNYRALAALFGVTTPDLPPLEHENVHYADAADMEIAALRQRIAELESRTVTVKLPQAVSAGGQGYQAQVERILTAAGIKVEAE